MATSPAKNGNVAQVFLLKQQTICSDKSGDLSSAQKEAIKEILNGRGNVELYLTDKKNKNDAFYHELLRKAVLSRNNYIILQVLQTIHSSVGVSGDIEGTYIENTESAACINHAIHLATVRDDFETLDAILDWAQQRKMADTILKYTKTCARKQCSLQVAILQQFDECVQILDKFGFEIDIHPEDKESIDYMLQDSIFGEDTSAYLYFKNCFQAEHFFKRHSKEGLENQDAIDRYLKFRAYSTPCYIAATFDNYLSRHKADLTEENWTSYEDKKVLKDKISMLDPIRKLFICAQRAQELSLYFVQHREEYHEIASNCNLYAKTLLEQCEDLSQVRCLLQCDEKQKRLTKIWEIALMEKNTEFVSHHYFQHIMYRKFCGEEMDYVEQNDWNNFFIIRKISHYLFTLYMGVLYPLIIFLDLFRGATILFESPKVYQARQKKVVENNDENLEEGKNLVHQEKAHEKGKPACCSPPENYIFRKFRNNLHRPMSRMILDVYAEFFFLFTLILTVVDPCDSKGVVDFNWYDVYSHLCFFSYFINNIIEICKWGTNYFSHFWKVYSLINSLLFVIGSCIRLYGFKSMNHDIRSVLSGNHYVNVGTTFYALATIMVILQSCRWLLRIRQTGPMVLCIIQCFKDICLIVILFVIIIVAFIFGIWLLYNVYDEEKFAMGHNYTKVENPYIVANQDYTQLRKVPYTLFWSVFSLPTIKDAMVNYVSNYTSEDGTQVEREVSYEFSHVVMTALLAMYQGVCAFVLLNIMIALMNTTYTRIAEDADAKWKCSKTFLEYSYLTPSTAVPIPFRYLYYVAKLVYYQLAELPYKKAGNENIHYYLLSWKLIKDERLSRAENASGDNFKDMQNKDLMNYIDNEVIKRLEAFESRAVKTGRY